MNRSKPGEPLTAANEQEIESLYRSDAPGMFRYALAVARNREGAQDAVQEAFLRFSVARAAGQQIQRPRAWLFRVLHNHVVDEKKAGSRNEIGLESMLNLPDPRHDPEADYGRSELLRSALRTALAPREVECVRLRAEGLRYEEIAEVLKLRSGTVGALLTRAHRRIRRAAGAAGRRSTETGLATAEGSRYAS